MNNNFLLLLPEFIVTGLAFVVLGLDLFLPERRKWVLPIVAVVGLVVALVVSLRYLWGVSDSLYDGVIRVDGYALFFKAFFIALGGVVVLVSVDFVRRNLEHPGEYYGILLFTVVAMMLLAASGELLTAYISLELLSFGLYVLVAYDRYNAKSNEGATKYILLGAFSSALLLFGISQVYGLLGTTRFDEISSALSSADALSPGLILGIALIIAGLGFKVAAVPFHMWAPDAYEGAPIPITAHLAVGSKAAAFALVLRLFAEAFMPIVEQWQILLIGLAVITMLLGNLVALAQRNLKRLLAYSSVGQVGYLLMGVAALAATGSGGIMLHLVAYAVTNMAAFLCLAAIYNITGRDDIAGMAGVARRAPLVGLVFAVSLFSLAGLPIFVGFTSKFYLFNAAAAQGLLWVAGIAIFSSLISLYYYLQVVRQLYIEPAEDAAPIPVPRLTLGVLGALFAGMVGLGVYPAPLMEAVQYASDALF
ncbi:NADH-quinone oxidoreductase subunit N [Geodia barretti]|uniref:NADH:ubiquinone reductase (H(+)-translocating) n=1 Tax=Geodia barretti TaxID=519541 RepID=A0AA35XDP7_GEOBA|nr:NADH-quinone oxidoreductase subunit N [Geodia barretti]